MRNQELTRALPVTVQICLDNLATQRLGQLDTELVKKKWNKTREGYWRILEDILKPLLSFFSKRRPAMSLGPVHKHQLRLLRKSICTKTDPAAAHCLQLDYTSRMFVTWSQLYTMYSVPESRPNSLTESNPCRLSWSWGSLAMALRGNTEHVQPNSLHKVVCRYLTGTPTCQIAIHHFMQRVGLHMFRISSKCHVCHFHPAHPHCCFQHGTMLVSLPPCLTWAFCKVDPATCKSIWATIHALRSQDACSCLWAGLMVQLQACWRISSWRRGIVPQLPPQCFQKDVIPTWEWRSHWPHANRHSHNTHWLTATGHQHWLNGHTTHATHHAAHAAHAKGTSKHGKVRKRRKVRKVTTGSRADGTTSGYNHHKSEEPGNCHNSWLGCVLQATGRKCRCWGFSVHDMGVHHPSKSRNQFVQNPFHRCYACSQHRIVIASSNSIAIPFMPQNQVQEQHEWCLLST